jgi:L-ascorbate 6-phosphate lactonase
MKLKKYGAELLQEIRHTELPATALALWALGQEGFLVKFKQKTVLFDPYLSNWVYDILGEPWSRKFDTPLSPADCGEIDYVVCSHHHEDHMDKLTLQAIASAGETKFIVPKAHVSLMKEWGIRDEQVLGISHKESINLDGCQIEAFAAMHETFETNEQEEHKFLGYVLNFDGIHVYHAGDTVGFPDLVTWLSKKNVDIALIPINGRDFSRKDMGIFGNCNYREAADIAVQIHADLLIPMHYGLFPHNDENPAYFVDYLYTRYPQQKFHMFTPGERFIYMN